MLFFMHWDRGTFNTPWALAIPVTILLACLCLGCFTTWVSIFCAAGALLEMFLVPGVQADRALVASSISASLAQLGPGGYSVDSYRYGPHRRVFPTTD
jgi:hypothetical protein